MIPNILRINTTSLQTFPKRSVPITLIPKPDQKKKKSRELQTNIPYEYRCRDHQQNASKLNPAIYKKDYIL